MRQSIFFLFILLTTSLIGVSSALVVEIPETTGQVGTEVLIPITVSDCTNLGGMNIVVAYDAKILRPVKVEKGDIVKGLFSSDVSQDGLISISLADSQGINGEGKIALMKFRVLENGETPLKILHFRAYNVETHVDIKAELKDGNFKTEMKLQAPAQSPEEKKSTEFGFVLAAIVIVVGIVVLVVAKMRK